MTAAPDAAAYRDLASRAREQFPPSRFVHAPGVCVFVEHETLDADGEPLKFDAAALAAIAAACNARIAESGSFPVLAAGHTPTPEERAAGAAQPEVVGFCGPFRVGTFGASQKAAIFADEWRLRDAALRLSRLPRRSVELWRASEPENAFFDPIAALGAETPRLALGLHYSLDGGQPVVRYSAAAPCIEAKRDDADSPLRSFGSPHDPAAVRIVREEIRAWLDRTDLQATLERALSGREPETHREAEGDSTEVAVRPCLTYERSEVSDTNATSPAESELAKAHAALCFSMERLQRETADLRRETQLERLHRSQALDLETEKDRCLYARGSRMGDEDFERHVETLARYARPLPLGRTLPVGVEAESSDVRPARPETIAAAVEYADRMRRTGTPVRFRAALAHVRGESPS